MDFFRALMYVFTCFSMRCRKQLRLQLPGQQIPLFVIRSYCFGLTAACIVSCKWAWPVVSPGLTSASSSKVMRVTSLLEGLRARRPLAFLEESHLRLTNVTKQLLQGWPPPADTFYSWKVVFSNSFWEQICRESSKYKSEKCISLILMKWTAISFQKKHLYTATHVNNGWPAPSVRPLSSVLPVSLGWRWHLAFLILKEAVCFTGGAKVSTDKHTAVGGKTLKHHPFPTIEREISSGAWKWFDTSQQARNKPMQPWLLEFSLAWDFPRRTGMPQLTE